MSNIMDIIADETNGISYKSYKYCFDGMDVPSVDYDDHKEITWKKYGETKPPTGYEDMKPLADRIFKEKPLFTYFLDGSRHTYKVDDVAYKNQVYPVIAGQIGISCCTRIDGEMKPFGFKGRLAIVLPAVANQKDWDKNNNFFNNLCKKINPRRLNSRIFCRIQLKRMRWKGLRIRE